MSQSENDENLLIDFYNLTVSNEPATDTEALHNCTPSKATENQLFCASQPLYKLLAESNDVDANNPFDHFDKQARLLDDPFEMVEQAALISANSAAANTIAPEVKMATLIAIHSTMADASKGVLSSISSQTTLCDDTKSNDSVQNTPQKQATASKNIPQNSVPSSPSSANSITAANSAPTSRFDVIAMGNVLTSGEENVCSYVDFQNDLEISRKLGKNDSFDDIWSTVPNLIDSQTEIDNDIAELNIPMLKAVVNDFGVEPINDSIETKTLNRSNVLQKLASIKQKIPASIDLKPMSAAPVPIFPEHAQTIDINSGTSSSENHDNETFMPALKHTPNKVQHQPENVTANTDSLIKSMQKLVNQCDDKQKKMTAKYLLDNLSSILTKTIVNEKNNGPKTDGKNRQPSKVFRRQPFSGKSKGRTSKQSAIPTSNKSNSKIRVSQSITGQFRAQRSVNETRRMPSFI